MRAALAILFCILASAAIGEGRCDRHDPLRTAFVGDLHVHTALSLDAATQDTRARPADAYAFARGAALGIQPYDDTGRALRSMQLARPLDFAAVTDHSELLGEVAMCSTDGAEGHASWQCLVYRHVPRAAFFLFNYQASRNRRLGLCGDGGSLCIEAAAGPWREIQEAASAAYDTGRECRFTSFVAYEWTGARGEQSANMHRNVIFRGEQVPRLPISFVETADAETLWQRLQTECRESIPGCEVLAIPHNANLSAGYMFDGLRADGSAYTRADAELRARSEPVFEIMQHKGASECVPQAYGAVAADESCAFEQLPADSFGGMMFESQRKPPNPRTGFFREILRDGLRLQRSLGVDPFRMGVIGSTDTHIGAAGGTLETQFPGHGGAGVSARDGVPAGLPDIVSYNPGGLAFIYAEENTREALFAALQRRETYASSGTRPGLRFFGGLDLAADACASQTLVADGYAHGVPMGGEFGVAPGRQPTFVVAAQRDALEGQPLQRLEIVKGWIDAAGVSHERIVRVAGTEDGGEGAAELCGTWRDTGRAEGETAWYYARLLELPAERWSARVCATTGSGCKDPDSLSEDVRACCDAAHRPQQQERAWSSPIWVAPTPAAGA